MRESMVIKMSKEELIVLRDAINRALEVEATEIADIHNKKINVLLVRI